MLFNKEDRKLGLAKRVYRSTHGDPFNLDPNMTREPV